MRLIRIILQIIFGLLCAVTLLMLLTAESRDYGAIFIGLTIFVSIIFLLGPFWPNKEYSERLTNKWKFNLPTDRPEIARIVGGYCFAAFFACRAWYVYASPSIELIRFEKIIFALGGSFGIVIWWALLAAASLSFGIAMHSKLKRG